MFWCKSKIKNNSYNEWFILDKISNRMTSSVINENTWLFATFECNYTCLISKSEIKTKRRI